MAASLKCVKRAWGDFLKNKGHDFNAFPHLEIVGAKPNFVHAKMKVIGNQGNRVGTLHGGLTSSLVDTMGSLALASTGMWLTGVSTDINVTFVRGVPIGEEIKLTGEVINKGKSLAYTRVEIHNAESGKLVAYGSHTKYIAQALKAPENVELSPDGETEFPKAT